MIFLMLSIGCSFCSNISLTLINCHLQERYVASVIDLVSMTMLLCANNSAREVASNPRAEVKGSIRIAVVSVEFE